MAMNEVIAIGPASSTSLIHSKVGSLTQNMRQAARHLGIMNE